MSPVMSSLSNNILECRLMSQEFDVTAQKLARDRGVARKRKLNVLYSTVYLHNLRDSTQSRDN